MVDFPSYPEVFRRPGGVSKGLYELIKENSSSNLFISDTEEGTGSEKAIPHDLGVKPSKVLICPEVLPTGVISFVEGIHGTANIKINATAGTKFKIIAFP